MPKAIHEKIKTKRVAKHLSPSQIIDLIASIFNGRKDVFATRWENMKKYYGTAHQPALQRQRR